MRQSKVFYSYLHYWNCSNTTPQTESALIPSNPFSILKTPNISALNLLFSRDDWWYDDEEDDWWYDDEEDYTDYTDLMKGLPSSEKTEKSCKLMTLPI